MAKTLFKGFKQVNGLAEGFTESSLEQGYVYLVRTNADKTEGYIYFNGKKYGNIGTLDTKYDAAGAADTALQSAKEYADGLADNYDAAGAAATAEQNAKTYADGLAGNYDAKGAADTALASAKEYADGLADNYDAAGAAATAEQNAKDYADSIAVYYWDEDE